MKIINFAIFVTLLSLTPVKIFAKGQPWMVEIVRQLSSDVMQGRGIGLVGNLNATNYLINQISSVKSEVSKQEFTVFTRMEKVDENKILLNLVNNGELPSGVMTPEFEPIAFSNSSQLNNRSLVFAGYGISLPINRSEFYYDDYEFIDVANKIVIIFSNDPAVKNINSPFRDPKYLNYRSVSYKLQNALKHGAAGVIIVQDPLSLENQNPEEESNLYFNETQGGGNNLNIVAGTVKNRWLNYLIAKFSSELQIKNTVDLQNEINSSQRPHSFYFNDLTINLSVNLKKETGKISNIVVYLPGSDPVQSREVVVLGAHFDHLGLGGDNSMESDHSPKIHHGADDNASGCGLIFDLFLKLKNSKHKNSYMIIFFNGEESGLLGSQYFIDNWDSEKYGTIKFMLNFDMVGRFQNQVSVIGTGSAYEWERYFSDVNELVKDNDYKLPFIFNSASISSSDHASFLRKNIPILFFTTGAHEDYHRSSDTFDKINFPPMLSLSEYVEHFLRYIESENRPVTFNPDVIRDDNHSGRERGYGSYFGCIPKFGGVVSEVNNGVICTQTIPRSPSYEAGITEGDQIIQMGEIIIKNLYDLAFALKYYRPGDKIVVKFKRGEALLAVNVTLTNKTK